MMPVGVARRSVSRGLVRALCLGFLTCGALVAAAAGTHGAQEPHAPGAQTGAPRLGPPDAEVTVEVFSDFQCPFSARFAPVLRQFVEANPGRVAVTFHHLPLVELHPSAMQAHEAALAAGAQGRFWEMHDYLMANQRQVEQSDFVRQAEALGLDVGAFTAALEDGRYRGPIQADLQRAESLGIGGTPTILVRGRKLVGVQSLEILQAAIDGTLPEEGTRSEPRIDTAAGAVDFDLSTTPMRGSPTAPVTIVQFSDFQCPFCRTAAPVLEQLMRAYPGRIRWAFKHFPLDMHPQAPLLHVAAEAAGRQRRFWEMHDAILLGKAGTGQEELRAAAERLGLDGATFVRDLDGAALRNAIERDRQEGLRAGVTGTPTLFVNGRPVAGFRTLEQLRAIVDEALASAITPHP